MSEYEQELLTKIQDSLLVGGSQAKPEVEDYVAANLDDFIGVSVQHELFSHRFPARKLGISPGDVRLSLIVFILLGWFHQIGIDGNTLLYAPVRELWQEKA